MRDPWERLTGENSKAYSHFGLYRDIGKIRSLLKVAEDGKATVKRRQLERWSTRWRWVERAKAYDDHMAREVRLLNEEQILKTAEYQARLGQLLQSKAIGKLMALDPTTLTVNQAIIMAKIGAELERIALGMPTQIIKDVSKEPVQDLSKKTYAELREESIAALINAGLSSENARLIVDQLSPEGAEDEKQRRKSPPASNCQGEPGEGQ
jgi:hypothetical protein